MTGQAWSRSGATAKGDIDRRTLIRRAAIAGGAAWVAPVIVGSLASPAAAASTAGCYRYSWSWRLGSRDTTTCGWQTGTSICTNSLGIGCSGAGSYNSNPGPPTLSHTCVYNHNRYSNDTLDGTVSVSGSTCKIVAYRFSTSCGISGTSVAPTSSLTLPRLSGSLDYTRVYLMVYVQCS